MTVIFKIEKNSLYDIQLVTFFKFCVVINFLDFIFAVYDEDKF